MALVTVPVQQQPSEACGPVARTSRSLYDQSSLGLYDFLKATMWPPTVASSQYTTDMTSDEPLEAHRIVDNFAKNTIPSAAAQHLPFI